MNTMNKLKLSGLAGALLVALSSAQAHAAKPGYVVDQSTDAVTRNNYGECWKTTYFDKAKNGLAECGDAVAAAPVAAKPAAAPVTTKERISLSAKVLSIKSSMVVLSGLRSLIPKKTTCMKLLKVSTAAIASSKVRPSQSKTERR